MNETPSEQRRIQANFGNILCINLQFPKAQHRILHISIQKLKNKSSQVMELYYTVTFETNVLKFKYKNPNEYKQEQFNIDRNKKI